MRPEELAALEPGVLSARQRLVLERHVLGGETFEAIARDLGVSGVRVQQLAHRSAVLLRRRRERTSDSVA